jgi:solute carrier family 25 2-oxodicarboxylate transporter 21
MPILDHKATNDRGLSHISWLKKNFENVEDLKIDLSVVFENFKNALNYRGKDKQPSPLTYSMAGFLAGATEGLIVNPFEAIKVKAQSNTSHASQAPSTAAIVRQISIEEGWYRGILTKGLTATIGRNGVFNMVYFGFYHSVKDVVPVFSDPTAEFCKKVFCIGLQVRTCYNISL